MLRYEMMDNTEDRITYRYFPEGKEFFGSISVHKSDKSIVEQVIAPNDEFKWYFFHMYKRIRQYIDEDKFQSNGIVAWY